MEELLVQIGNVGFPIVVSMYLLVRLEGKMEELTKSITKLTDVLEKKWKGKYLVLLQSSDSTFLM